MSISILFLLRALVTIRVGEEEGIENIKATKKKI
jgi:hypothetical protein